MDNPRNYLSKIQRYAKVYDNVNSISHRGDFVHACLELWDRRAPFGAYNITNPGFVTTSALAMLQLVDAKQVTVIAKLSGGVLTLMVLSGGVVKLIRCLELGDVASDLYPTFAYVEDQLAVKAEMLLLCGFGATFEQSQSQFHKDLGIPVEALQSPLGVPGEANAGLLGYLQGAKATR